MLSSLLYGSDARRTKQGICFNTGRNKEVTEAAGVGGADYEAMSRAELVALAKERGIKANGKTVDIIKGLQELGAPVLLRPRPRSLRHLPPRARARGARLLQPRSRSPW